jgi:hypothetical protein
MQASMRRLLLPATQAARLRDARFYVLDNSIRETTVAAVRGHTLADKRAIMAAVRRCGVTDMLVATFSGTRMVDDVFAEEAVAALGPAHLWAFSELRDRVVSGVPDSGVPLGLAKCARYGLANCVIELDLDDAKTDWTAIGLRHFTSLIMLRLAWARVHLSPTGRVLINFRDFPLAWAKVPTRVKIVTAFLAQLLPSIRPEGLIFEDPSGECLPRELGMHVAATRAVMDTHGWADGRLLIHVHHAYGLGEAAVLESLACGATGVWSAVCREGAGVGHACSLMTLTNLARMGNAWVSRDFNMPAMRAAAIEVTRIVTGADPHPATEVYGARSLVRTRLPAGREVARSAAMDARVPDVHQLVPSSSLAISPPLHSTRAGSAVGRVGDGPCGVRHGGAVRRARPHPRVYLRHAAHAAAAVGRNARPRGLPARQGRAY